MTGADKGDLVKFAVVVENIGKQSAFDLLLNDQLPDGFELPTSTEGLNFNIHNGAGTQLNFVDEAGNVLNNDAEIIAKLFSTNTGEGIRIADTVNGSIAAGKTSDGTVINTGDNIIIITYDLQAKADIDPATVHTGTAELLEYAVQEGGTDFTTGISGDWQDAATVTAISSELTKTLTGTEFNDATNENDEAVIGEWVRYTLVLTVPEITTNAAKIVDTLDTGLSFFDVESVTPSSGDIAFNGSPLTPTVTGSNGDTITFNFGTISNSNTDNTTAETITIVYRALATNVETNQSTANEAGPDLDNSAVFSWNNGSGAQSLASVSADEISIIEPELTLSQTIRVDSDGNGFDAGDGSTGDVDDDVEFTITLEHSGTSEADAYDLVLNNTLPTGLDGLTITSVTGTSSAVLGDFEIVGGNNLQIAAGQNVDLIKGQTIIIKVTGTINNTVSPQETIANTVNVQWSSFDGDITDRSSDVSVTNDDERAGALGTTNTGDYNASDTTNLSIASSGLTKTLTGTEINDATNENDEAVIGEWVRYTLVLTVPEITTNAAKIVDTLDAGLSFFDVESVTSSSGDVTFSGTPLSPTIAGSNGEIITFDFGTISNSNTDNATAETITIVYRALATNVGTNQSTANEAGPNLDNSAVFSFTNGSGTQSLASVSADEISIIEPELTLSQIVRVDSDSNGFDAGDGTTGDIGDNVEFTITLEHSATSEADAYDLVLNNTLPTGLDGLTITSVTGTSSAVLSDFEIVGANNLQVAAGQNVDLVKGQTIIIKVTGTINNTVSPQETIANTVNVQWSSFDGDITDRSSDISITNDDERAGALGTTNTGDYNASDTTNLSIASSGLTKTLTGTEINDATNENDEAVIGEWVRYTLVLTVPEVTTNAAQIVDTLDAGLSFFDVESVTPSSSDVTFTGSPLSPTIASGGESITFNFGTISNSNTDNTTAETITIVYRALVTNVGSNQSTINEAGPNLDNSAVYSFNNGSGVQSLASVSADEVSIIEPVLTVSTSTSGVPAIANIGDTFQFTTSVDHDGGSATTANDLQLTDTMPPELKIISIDSIGGTNSLGLTPANFTITPGGTGWTLNPGFDLVLADDFTLTYTVEILNIIDLNQGLNNDVDLSWDSLDGANSNARDGSDGPAGALNDYAVTATDTITTNNISISKIISDTNQAHTNGNDVVIGETIIYELTINLSETTTGSVVVNDVLPQQLSYIAGSLNVINGNAGMTTQFVDENTSSSYDSVTRTLTVNLGDINNPDNLNSTDDKVILQYQAVVENDINNQSPNIKTNNVEVTSVGGAATDTTDAVILEPELEISLAVSNKTPINNEIIQFTLTVDHASVSESDAFDLTLTNLLTDPDLTITGIDSIGGTNSAGLNINDFVITPDGSGIVFAAPGTLDLGLTDDFTLNFSVKVNGDPASIGHVNDTIANLSWSSINGDNDNERDGTGGVNDYNTTTNQDVTLSPIPPKPTLPIFVFDASHNDADQDDEDNFFYRKDRLVTLPPLPIFPIFSGATEPGTTLNFKLYNEAGAEIGSQTVMADTGGNWLANFPGNIMFDQPHSMRVEQTASVVSIDGASGFNLRTYFSPAMNEQLFFSHAYTPETVFSNTASASLQAIHQGLNNPFNLGGGDFYAYEYLSSSSTTTQGQ